jgi:hypothetical protein
MGSTSAASSQVLGGGIKPGMGLSLETAKAKSAMARGKYESILPCSAVTYPRRQ